MLQVKLRTPLMRHRQVCRAYQFTKAYDLLKVAWFWCCSSQRHIAPLGIAKLPLRAGDVLALRESSSQWNHMSASLQADIPMQPAMLKGGSLRDYQMAVSPSAGAPTP